MTFKLEIKTFHEFWLGLIVGIVLFTLFIGILLVIIIYPMSISRGFNNFNIENKPYELMDYDSFGTVMGTGSMLPTINPFTTVYYKNVSDINDIITNDIILYKKPTNKSILVLHRCIKKIGDSCITKGDANVFVDEYIVNISLIKAKVKGLKYGLGTTEK